MLRQWWGFDMGLETFGFIDDLNPDFPLSSDPVSEGDDHLRGIKLSVQGSIGGQDGQTTIPFPLAVNGKVSVADEVPTGSGDLTAKSYVDPLIADLQGQIDNILNGTTPFTGDVNGTDWIANGP